MSPRLTNRGWSLLGAAFALLVGSRVLAVDELGMLAAVAGLVIVVAALRVWRRAVSLSAERQLRPTRAEAGSSARAQLVVRNTGTRATPVLSATDVFGAGPAGDPWSRSGREAAGGTAAVSAGDPWSRSGREAAGGTGALPGRDGRRVARFLVPRLAPGESAQAAYRLPTDRRGIWPVGPLTLAVTDPFGMVEATVTVAGADRFVVYPKVTDVLPLPGAANREARMGAMAGARVPVGLDLFGLRQYEVGDDLRRVHWRSTARTGELMLRQDEMPWESRAAILLDTRPASYPAGAASFETAVEIAASLTTSMCRGRRQVRFLTTGGLDVRSAGAERYPMIMEYLAGARTEPAARLDGALDRLRRHGGAGPLAVVTGTGAGADLPGLGGLRARRGLVLVALVGPLPAPGDAAFPGAAPPGPGAPGAVVVPVPSSEFLQSAWNQAVMTCQGSTVAPRS